MHEHTYQFAGVRYIDDGNVRRYYDYYSCLHCDCWAVFLYDEGSTVEVLYEASAMRQDSVV